jgi:hypothetical protein
MNFLFTFKTFVDVFSCEKIGNAAGLSCRVIPVPRSLDISCEYATEFQNIDECDFYTILELLKKNNLSHIRAFHSYRTVDGEMY